jgi:integration host factor subunit alpha
MAVTKSYLTSSIHNMLDLPMNQPSRLVESLLENIKRTFSSGEDILISGFGKFCVKDKKTKRGRNPQTGDDLMLHGRRVQMLKREHVRFVWLWMEAGKPGVVDETVVYNCEVEIG